VARQRADEEAEAARMAVARADVLCELEAWERKAVAALSAVVDSTERDMRLLAAGLPSVFTPELRALVPSSWNNAEVVRWFLRAVTAPPETVRISVKTLLGGYKDKYVSGWAFEKGSTVTHPYGHGDSGPGHVYVLADGRVYYHWKFEPEPAESLNLRTLKRMFQLTGLAPLTPVRPRHWEDPTTDPETGDFLPTYRI
jgi:hypothetical protein